MQKILSYTYFSSFRYAKSESRLMLLVVLCYMNVVKIKIVAL